MHAQSLEFSQAAMFGQAFVLKPNEVAVRRTEGVVARPMRRVDRAAWDDFAGATSASFQASYSYLQAQALKSARRLRFFEFYDHRGTEQKIGQCAVFTRGGKFEIQDGLQLAPGQEGQWRQAMSSLLRELGPGEYLYGGFWSCEPARHEQFAQIRGVELESSRPFSVQAVDFSRWPSWEAYWKKVSDSVRYEAKYAPERVPGLRLERFSGLDMLKAIKPIVTLQQVSYARKGIHFSRLKQGLRYAFYMALGRRELEVVLAVADAGVLAAYYGASLGPRAYYIYGGQQAGSSGANWYLLKEMTRAAFEAVPTGRFVMGNFDPAVHEEATGGGLLRSRRALRVSDFPTSLVRFRYQAD